jgi:oligoendopeptidase F
MQDLRSGDAAVRADVVSRYLGLLRAGGSGYPMDLLRAAGVDLREAATVRAVATELDGLVSTLESELAVVPA